MALKYRYIYSLVVAFLIPFAWLRLFWRSRRNPDYRKRWIERFGILPGVALKDAVWVHAVSVGESQAADPLVKLLIQLYGDVPIVMTSTTPTGAEHISKLFGDRVSHYYFPFDLGLFQKWFLAQINPRLIILMETEIWPNLLHQCSKRNVPVVLANARLSERSASRYAWFAPFTRQVFTDISMVAAQSPADAERFLGLGVDPDRVRVTGSIKFDIRIPGSVIDQAEALRRQFNGRRVWIAASTHDGEEEQILAVHGRVTQVYPDALLILVPRHLERFKAVFNLIETCGFNVCRRSDSPQDFNGVSVFLGDTMGELPVFLAASDISFIGGSLAPIGGHNILEPAALEVPVVFGPHMENFSVISSMFLARKAAVQVHSKDDLYAVVVDLLGDASKRACIGGAGKRLVDENSGVLDRLHHALKEFLGEGRRPDSC